MNVAAPTNSDCLTDALQRAQRQQAPSRIDQRARSRADSGQQRADDHRQPQAVPLGEGPEPRSDQHGGDAEDREVQPDVDLVATELFLDQPRQQRDHHTDVDEQRQRRQRSPTRMAW